MEKAPHYYLLNTYDVFKNIQIDCIDFLYDKIQKDLENDVVFLYNMLHYLSFPSDVHDKEFIDFINLVVSKIDLSKPTIKRGVKTLFNEISLKTDSFIECANVLNKEYHICISDIADVFKEDESIRFVIEQEFKTRNMWYDSFDTKIIEINIDDLEW